MRRAKRWFIWAMTTMVLFSATGVMADADIVQDRAGRRIQAQTPFSRIISLYGAHTRNLISLGLNAQIIGVCPSDLATGKPVFSYHDGLEKFLAAQPDLVLVRPMIDRGYPKLMAGLARAGITVASFQPSNIAAVFDYWMALGRLTGQT